jgi:hypothetical protein
VRTNHILSVITASCLAAFLGAPSALADVVPLSSLSLVGTSQILSNGTLRLTPNFDTAPLSDVSPAGAAWTASQHSIADPFSVNFHFQMSDPTGNLDGKNGGDGIAFVIQNSGQGTSAIGEGAGGMGFLGIFDSVAVMLDTYQNSTPNFYGDPSNNYIAVNTRGTDFNVPHHFCTNGQLTDITSGPMAGVSDLPGALGNCTGSPTLGMTTINPLVDNMDIGAHDVGITYTGTFLDIYLDSTLVLAVGIDLGATLNSQDAFLGFTAGTRHAYQNQDILDFTITPEPVWGQLWVPLAMILAAVLTRRWQRGRS